MNYGRPMDYYNLKLEKSVLEFDQTHVVKIGASYELPVGRGRHFGSNMHGRSISSRAAGPCSISATTQAARRSASALPARPTRISLRTARSSLTRAADRCRTRASTAATFDMTDISNPRADKKYIVTSSKVIDPVTFDRYCAWKRAAADFAAAQFRQIIRKMFAAEELRVPTRAYAMQFRAEFLNLFNRHRFTRTSIPTRQARCSVRSPV